MYIYIYIRIYIYVYMYEYIYQYLYIYKYVLKIVQPVCNMYDDDDVYLSKITTYGLQNLLSILIRNQPERHKYKMESIRKKYL
jgi:hypothetical protein